MPNRLTFHARTAAPWLDAALAAVVAVISGEQLTLSRPHDTGLAVTLAAAELLAVFTVAFRRRRPLELAVVLSAACFLPGLVIGARWANAPSASLQLALIILGYTVGTALDLGPALIGLVAVGLGSSGGDFTDPIGLVVFTLPAWAVGRAIRARLALTVQLAERAREVELEREAYTQQAIRYERARIARDLHDLVAHNISMIVIQAGAGRRALASDPDTAEESLRHIAAGAARAESEIAQLMDLLGDRSPSTGAGARRALDELVARVRATGTPVAHRVAGGLDGLPAELVEVVLHVTQEGATNAVKHAPGAPVDISLRVEDGSICIAVRNGPPGQAVSGLERAGGGHGLLGLRDRVIALGGELRAGASADGGWCVEAELPGVGGAVLIAGPAEISKAAADSALAG